VRTLSGGEGVKAKIYFMWPDADRTEDTLIFECEDLEDGRRIAKEEMERRGAEPISSEILED